VGSRYLLADGRSVLDASNVAAPLGHAHPALLASLRDAPAVPVLNDQTRWGPRERAASELVATAFAGEDWAGGVRFCVSGSEANDLALSLAQALTGRAAFATRPRSYHGGSGLARELTLQPHWQGAIAGPDGAHRSVPRTTTVRVLPEPAGSRIGVARVVAQQPVTPADLADVAAVIVDYSQGGVAHSGEYQDSLAGAARSAGALWIADEVSTGFGRTGAWFSFQHGKQRPDLVTLGKALGAGAAPAGAIVFSRRVAAAMDRARWQTHGTFRGHPVAIIALRTLLGVISRERLVDRVAALDQTMYVALLALAERHPSVLRIEGSGLHWTIELRPAPPGSLTSTAGAAATEALAAGALISTAGAENLLILAPPLIVTDAELAELSQALDRALNVADATYNTTAVGPSAQPAQALAAKPIQSSGLSEPAHPRPRK